MRIADILVEMVRRGTNWRFVPAESEEFDAPMEQWDGVEVVDAGHVWSPADSVLYSGLVVLSTGQVVPELCLKEAMSPESGGDYCWFVNGAWRQLGLDHVVGPKIVNSYTASPLSCDPSFDSQDGSYRDEQSVNFERHVGQMSEDVFLILRPRYGQGSDHDAG